MHNYNFYNGTKPESTVKDVERCILKSSIDPDGISKWDWLSALMTDDLPDDLITYIITHKDVEAIRPMYERLRVEIVGILDKDE